jgi:hypothetical protein
LSNLLHPDIAWNATYPSITAFTMDFLPLPDGLSEHELVPELPGAPYDNQGFSGYDVRQGWNVKLLREGNIRGARSEWNEYSQASLAEHGDDVHEFSGEQLVQFLVAPSFRIRSSMVSFRRLLVVTYPGMMPLLPASTNVEKCADI